PHHSILRSFPTRRSSDLFGSTERWIEAVERLSIGKVHRDAPAFLAPQRSPFGLQRGSIGEPHHPCLGTDQPALASLEPHLAVDLDRKSTRLNSSHVKTSY